MRLLLLTLTILFPCSASTDLKPWQKYLKLGNISRPLGLTLNRSNLAHRHFEIGYLCLHSFLYSEARESFQFALDIDPAFIYAHIGRILACKRPVWSSTRYPCGQHAISQAEASVNISNLIGRQKLLFETVKLWYRNESNIPEDENAFLESIKNVSNSYPNDTDIKAWYGLALLNVADQVRFQNQTDPLQINESRRILLDAYRMEPRHPGVLHYLIHAHDVDLINVVQNAINYATSYGEIVTTASHAQHMPSHIWMRIGSWNRAVQADRSAVISSLSLCATKILNETYIVNSTELEPVLNRTQLVSKTSELLACDEANRRHSLEWVAFAGLQQGNLNSVVAVLKHLYLANQNSTISNYLYYAYRVQARALVDLFFWFPYRNEFIRETSRILALESPKGINQVNMTEERWELMWSEATMRFGECVRLLSNRNTTFNNQIISEHLNRIEILKNMSASKNLFMSGNIAMMTPLIQGMRAYVRNRTQEALNFFSDATSIENKLVQDRSSRTLVLGRAAEFLGLHLQLIHDSDSRVSARSLNQTYNVTGSLMAVRDFPKKSIELFSKMNQTAPNRAINLLGWAKGQNQSGNVTEASRLYNQLQKQLDNTVNGGDTSFLNEVNSLLQSIPVHGAATMHHIGIVTISTIMMLLFI